MKTLLLSLFLSGISLAGEIMLAEVYQPLNGFGSDGLVIAKVTCKNKYGMNGMPAAELITAANIAPTNDPEGAEDINIASYEKLKFSYDEKDGDQHKPLFMLDCTQAKKQPNHVDMAYLVRATLECLRLSFPEVIGKAELVFKIPEGMDDVRAVTEEFVKHDKSQPFFKQP